MYDVNLLLYIFYWAARMIVSLLVRLEELTYMLDGNCDNMYRMRLSGALAITRPRRRQSRAQLEYMY